MILKISRCVQGYFSQYTELLLYSQPKWKKPWNIFTAFIIINFFFILLGIELWKIMEKGDEKTKQKHKNMEKEKHI